MQKELSRRVKFKMYNAVVVSTLSTEVEWLLNKHLESPVQATEMNVLRRIVKSVNRVMNMRIREAKGRECWKKYKGSKCNTWRDTLAEMTTERLVRRVYRKLNSKI